MTNFTQISNFTHPFECDNQRNYNKSITYLYTIEFQSDNTGWRTVAEDLAFSSGPFTLVPTKRPASLIGPYTQKSFNSGINGFCGLG